MTLIADFFRELDALSKASAVGTASSAKVRLRVIGSSALMLQTDYARGTKDSDVLETADLTDALKSRLLRHAGKGSRLHTKYAMYLELVPSGLPFLPQGALYHPSRALNASLESFQVDVLDVVDVVVSKLARFHANDRDDIAAMVDLGVVPHDRLVLRFRAAVDSYAYDARAPSIPQYVKNLHVVERDFLDVAESAIDLPEWLDC